jgi:hypothetical protein
MNRAYLDPKNYTFAGGFTVQSNKDLVIPDSLVLAPSMMVRWQIRQMVKGVTIDQIPPATLTSSVEIDGFGVLQGQDQQILASNDGKKRVQLITLDPSLPLKILFHQVSDLVTNSVLEFYSATYPIIYIPNMGVTNPSSSDPAALQAAILATIPAMAQAIGQQSGAAVQIALANNNSSLEASISTTKASVIKAWSGDIRNHQILDVNLTRLAIHGTHPGKNLLATNIADVFLAVGSITGRDQNKWDHVLSAGGEFISDPDKERLPLYAWLAVGKPDTTITVTEYFPQPVVSA